MSRRGSGSVSFALRAAAWLIAMCCLVALPAAADDVPGDPHEDCGTPDFQTTFEGIQDVIFEGYGCTNGACHGTSGGLSLAAGVSYEQLLGADLQGAPSAGSLFKRVEPAEPALSFLYLKLLAKTDPARLAELHPGLDVGTPMPSGAPALTAEHLEALRLWIRGGAPDDRVVDGTAELLGTCLPEPDPLKIAVPDPPSAGSGFQLQQTPWPLAGLTEGSQGEDEICMATFYDLTATQLLPEWASVACPSFFELRKGCSNDPNTRCTADPDCGAGNRCIPVKNATNPDDACLVYHKQRLYQDPQSHHSIIHVYTGGFDETDPGWGEWTYKFEPDDPRSAQNGQPCDPTAIDPALGYNPGCSGAVVSSVACNDYGPDDTSQFSIVAGGNLPAFSGSQEPFYEQELADGVFATLPARGIVVWNSHAFNLTSSDSTMAQYLNLDFATPEDQLYPQRGIFDARWIFAENVPPFEQQEICSTHTLPQGARLFQLSSHTHLRGVRFRIWAPPNERCRAPCMNQHPLAAFFGCETEPEEDPDMPVCEGPRNDAPIYFSTDYSDPLQLELEPPLVLDSPDHRDRTLLFCSLFDNGSTPESPPVKRQSTSPVPPPIAGLGDPTVLEPVLGGPCPPATVACLDGPNKGQLCGQRADPDGFCGGEGLCDACPAHGGVTTEDEMFILLGSFYLLPEPSTWLLRFAALGLVGLVARRRLARHR